MHQRLSLSSLDSLTHQQLLTVVTNPPKNQQTHSIDEEIDKYLDF